MVKILLRMLRNEARQDARTARRTESRHESLFRGIEALLWSPMVRKLKPLPPETNQKTSH